MAFAALWTASLGIGCGARSEAREPFVASEQASELDAGALDRAVDAIGGYIVTHTGESGRFTYVLDGEGRSDPTDYNVLRHGGTIYALGELRRRQGPSADIDAAIARAALYLVRHHLGSFESPAGIGGPGALAVWSAVGEEIDGERREAKLGGAGLGLVALASAREIDAGIASLESLRGLGLAIEAMQKESGHFASKVIEGGGVEPRFVSLYYPGEAVLGLARLYRADPDPRWIDVAGKAIAALIEAREELDDDELPADHWLLIAIGELAALAADRSEVGERLPVSVDAMLTHAVRIADSMLAEQRAAGAAGSFHKKRRSTPSATRLEGILALLAVLPADHPARERLAASARAGVRFLLTCRVVAGPAVRRGGITRQCPPGGRGRSNEIRIDYAQHALSAILGARALGL